MAPRVLVVDDDPSVRRMLERTLLAEGFEVALASDGGAALAAVERTAPDVVVLDVAMGGLDGLAVCRRLRAKGFAAAILMLTARDAIPDRVAGLESGADDYLVKPFATAELVARLRAFGRRSERSGDVLRHADLTLDSNVRLVRRGELEVSLTARESALLALLLAHPRRVLTREHALAAIWDEAAGANVVDRYVARLRHKLGDPPAIDTVRGVGFMLHP